jgi:hypothetical protein
MTDEIEVTTDCSEVEKKRADFTLTELMEALKVDRIVTEVEAKLIIDGLQHDYYFSGTVEYDQVCVAGGGGLRLQAGRDLPDHVYQLVTYNNFAEKTHPLAGMVADKYYHKTVEVVFLATEESGEMVVE